MQGLLDRFPGHRTMFLNVAQGILVDKPTLAHTVLGSCVSVTFFVPSRGMSAIFHALLPRAADYRLHDPCDSPYKFVDSAIQTLAARFNRRGVALSEIECKVFGGASALFDEGISVGRKNVETAFETLSTLGLRVAASNVGGPAGRKIIFSTTTGEIFVRMLKNGGAK